MLRSIDKLENSLHQLKIRYFNVYFEIPKLYLNKVTLFHYNSFFLIVNDNVWWNVDKIILHIGNTYLDNI